MSAMADGPGSADAIRVRGVGKRFPGVIANHDVDIDIRSGTVRVQQAALRGTRVPLVSWEQDPAMGTRDKGLLGFLQAYVGHQLGDRDLIDRGLAAMAEASPGDPLLALLRQVWGGEPPAAE